MENNRKFVLHTGIKGMQSFDKAMRVKALKDLLESTKKYYLKDQYKTLTDMIDSPDLESFDLANHIIRNNAKGTDSINNDKL